MPDSTLPDPLPTSEWHDSLAQVRKDMSGRPLNVHELLAQHPALLAAWWPLRMHCVANSSLDDRDQELVILRTAVHLRCWYEWASHVVRGQAAGLTAEDIDRVLDGPSAEGWSRSEAALLDAVDALYTTQRLSAELIARLKRDYSAQQLLDLVATHSMYMMLGCLLNTRPIALDADVRARLPATMTEEEFLNRAGRA